MTVTEHSRHLTASMVVIDPSAMAVLLVHHKAMDLWVFPGGHLDPDETLAECALREVREETGVEATIFDESGFTIPGADWHPGPWVTAAFPAPAKPHKNEPAHTHIDHLFIGTADSRQTLKAQPAEVHGVRWFSLNNEIILGSGLDEFRAEVPTMARRAMNRLVW